MIAESTIDFGNDAQEIDLQDTPYVFFMVADKAYGVSSHLVLSMHTMEGCTPIVDFPAHIRGVVDFRGQAISLCDLRMLFNATSYADELEALIAARITDHENWVKALEKSVTDRTPFTLTTDPHKCAFGKWLDTFQTENNVLRAHLQQVSRPHQLVHQTGIVVGEYVVRGDYDGAMKVIGELKATHYRDTLDLLGQIGTVYRRGHHEIVIVLELEGKTFGIIVDKIISVEPILELIPMPEGRNSTYITQIAKRAKEPNLVLLLDCEKL